MDNSKRTGKFTSSQMSRLISFEKRKMNPDELLEFKKENPKSRFTTCEKDGFGKAGKTYIEEVFYERISNRSIETQVKTVPMKWGSLMEVVLFSMLSMAYEMTHKQTIVHSKFNFWSGTPDLIAKDVQIGEIKCFQPKNFINLTLCLLKKNVELFKDEFTSEYWQCVSNAILCGVTKAEIIVFMPHKSQLIEIIDKVEETDFLELNGLNPQDYYFLTRDNIESMAYLPDKSRLDSITSFQFEIPQEDIDFLTERVCLAEVEVNKLIKQFETT